MLLDRAALREVSIPSAALPLLIAVFTFGQGWTFASVKGSTSILPFSA